MWLFFGAILASVTVWQKNIDLVKACAVVSIFLLSTCLLVNEIRDMKDTVRASDLYSLLTIEKIEEVDSKFGVFVPDYSLKMTK